jgi:hypothetical protein
MNKILTALICIIGMSLSATGQVGIGTSSPDASAALDVTSSDKGLLMPRMTTAQRTAIASPASSLMVFDTDTNSYWSYIENVWIEDKPGEGKFIEGAAADIAYFDGRVGIGLAAFSKVHKLYVENVKEDNSGNTSGVIRGVFNGTGTGGVTYGLVGVARNNSTGTIPYAIGTQGIIENRNAGSTMTTAVGSYPQVYNSGNVNFGSAMIAENYNNAGTMATGRGMDVGLINASGATIGAAALVSAYGTNKGTITGVAYGLFVGGADGGSVGGDSYALYLDTPFSNVAGDAYALYANNANNSYFAGNVGFGNLAPQQKVHISGVLRLEPQATPPTGGAGDLYAGTDNKLYFHDGTSWKEIQFVTP